VFKDSPLFPNQHHNSSLPNNSRSRSLSLSNLSSSSNRRSNLDHNLDSRHQLLHNPQVYLNSPTNSLKTQRKCNKEIPKWHNRPKPKQPKPRPKPKFKPGISR